MNINDYSAGLTATIDILATYEPPGPQCAVQLTQSSDEDWKPEDTPWLSSHQPTRERALDRIMQAYQDAAQYMGIRTAADLAKELAVRMTAGPEGYMQQLYLTTAAQPSHYQESFRHLITLASRMPSGETAMVIGEISIGLTANTDSKVKHAATMLERRIKHAEDTWQTGKVTYTDSTDINLAKEIDAATYQRERLLCRDLESTMRHRLPGRLDSRHGLHFWNLYGQPDAVAIYAEVRTSLGLQSDRDLLDNAIVKLTPWPMPIGHGSWTPLKALQEILHLYQRSAERDKPWDGTVDFSC